MEPATACKNRFSSGLPTRPNATIRSPVAASMEHGRQAANTAYRAHNALIFRLFCSLRLSVRTPPFHGGESGSIPLGSAKSATTIDFPLFLNDLANTPGCVLDVLLDGRRAPHCALICSAAAPRFTVVEAIESVSVRPSRCQYAQLSRCIPRVAGFGLSQALNLGYIHSTHISCCESPV